MSRAGTKCTADMEKISRALHLAILLLIMTNYQTCYQIKEFQELAGGARAWLGS